MADSRSAAPKVTFDRLSYAVDSGVWPPPGVGRSPWGRPNGYQPSSLTSCWKTRILSKGARHVSGAGGRAPAP